MTAKVNLNAVLNAYGRFAETNGGKTAGRLRFNGKDCKISVVPLTKGFCTGADRELRLQVANDRARQLFFDGVAAQFGGAQRIPEKVRKAMYEKGFGDVRSEDGERELRSKFMTGKPLEARQIKKVVRAVSTAARDNPGLSADGACERRGRTNAELLDGKTRFDPANPNRAYDVNDISPEDFLRVLMHATACAEEGKAFAGDGTAKPGERMLEWVRARMCELIMSGMENPDEKTQEKIRGIVNVRNLFAHSDKVPLMRQVANVLLQADTATSWLPVRERGGEGISPQRKWFKSFYKLVLDLQKSEYNLDRMLLEGGLVWNVTGRDVETVRNIAKYALGSKAGREGGEGYMGLADGKAFKFLTNFGERMKDAGRGLSGQEKEAASEAARQLKAALEGIADRIEPAVANAVRRQLALKEVDGIAVLERKGVARAVTVLAPYLIGQNGERFSWDDLEREGAVRLPDTYLKSALAEVRDRAAEPPPRDADGRQEPPVREEPKPQSAPAGDGLLRMEEPERRPEPKPLAPPVIVPGERVEQYVASAFPRDAGAAARLVNSSATNLNCLFYSLQKCVGQGEDDAGAEEMRKTLDFLAKQDLQAYCAENGFDYRQVVDNATENGNLPAGFAHEKMALAQYLHEVEHGEGNVFADAVLLKYAASVYRRPIVLVTPQRRGEETFLASETFNPNNPGPGDEKPIYLYLQANHYQTILVGEQAAGVNGSAPAGGKPAAGEELIDTRSKPSQAQPAAKQPASDPAVGKSLPRAITGKKISAKEEQAALEYMRGKDEELSRLLKGATSSLARINILTEFMKACFDDKAFRRNSAIAAKALGLGIVTKADLRTGKVNKKGLPALGKLGRQNFVIEPGSTDAIAARYKQAHPEAKVCAQDFADNTLTFGGIFKGWTTQEETLFRQVGLVTFGPLFDHELTEPGKGSTYVYTADAKTRRTKVIPAEGYLIKGRQDRAGGVTLEKNLDMHYLVSCAPSFPKSGESFDPHNNAQCAIATFKAEKGVEPTGRQYANGVAMLKRVWELRFAVATRNKMQKILIFTGEIDLFNLKPKKQDAVLGKLAKDIEAGRYDDLLAKINADDGGYDRALQARFDGWVKMCSAAEIDYLIAGPIGCGAFGNDARKIARAFARAWVKYGKGDFIYGQYGDDSETAEIFRTAFEEARRLRVKLLEEDGYEAAEIVAALREGGYTAAEIEQLLRDAGHTEDEVRELTKEELT